MSARTLLINSICTIIKVARKTQQLCARHRHIFQYFIIFNSLKNFCGSLSLQKSKYCRLKKCITFIAMTLVNKIIQVTSVQCYNTLTVYCTVFTTQSQVSFYHHVFELLYPFLSHSHHPFPLVTTTLLSVSMCFVCFSCLFICCFQFHIPQMSETILFLTSSI